MRLLQVIRGASKSYCFFKKKFIGEIEKVLGSVNKKGVCPSMLAIHCHDTYGQALANILIAMEVFID